MIERINLTENISYHQYINKINEIIDVINGSNDCYIYAVVSWSDDQEPLLKLFKTESKARDVFEASKREEMRVYLDVWDLSEME